MKPPLSIVVSIGKNLEIGKEGDLIWRISEDLKRFKQLTMGGTLIMGRKTFESIGRPLPGRINIVISSRKDFYPDGVWVAASPEEALELARCLKRPVYVIGGEAVFRWFLPHANRLYLTEVDASDPDADVFFPVFNSGDWQEKEATPFYQDEKNGVRYRYRTLNRKN